MIKQITREVSEGLRPSDFRSCPAACTSGTGGHFTAENPIFQRENAYLTDLPPGNRLRFQANLEGVASAGELAPPSDYITNSSVTERDIGKTWSFTPSLAV